MKNDGCGMTTYEPHEWCLGAIRPEWQWLADAAANVNSQFGEDGIISAFFSRYGTTNRHCFEVGAADGVFFSNTLELRKAGWTACLIEPNPDDFLKLLTFADPKTKCVKAKVGTDGGRKIDDVLAEYDFPTDMDLGVIDIDSADYWAWQDMVVYRPRLMLVEFAECRPGKAPPPKSERKQAGEEAIIDLAEQKGYVPLVRTRVNLICADKGVL